MRTLVGAAPLIALFALDTRRQRIAVRRSGTSIAELCLDEGHIQAKGRILGFRELEIELCNQGVPDDLQQIAGLLVDHFALIPEPRGKRSRGLALLQALTEPYARTVGAQRSREAIVW
jgi:inorganic triphosphatase YgiF